MHDKNQFQDFKESPLLFTDFMQGKLWKSLKNNLNLFVTNICSSFTASN